jgi:hypothetical protein
MAHDRFAVIFDKLLRPVVETDTMRATIFLEDPDASELDELRRLAMEFEPPTPPRTSA